MVVPLGQQHDTGEKPTVMLYTYIKRHAGTPDNKNKNILSIEAYNHIIILYTVNDRASTFIQ
jgi:hypothetical protein